MTTLVEKVAHAIRWTSMDESTAAAWQDDTFKATKGELKVAQSAISAVYDWQDISALPEDEDEQVIVFAPKRPPFSCRVLYANNYRGATHWLPLPTPPQTGEG